MAAKPNVIVLGGLGFIGRTLVSYLLRNDLVSKIRIADKLVVANAYLSPEHTKMIDEDPRVDFKQVNLAREASMSKVFEGGPWDFVFNCAGETKYSQGDVVYKENILEVSTTTAKAAAAHQVKKFIEVSTAQVYECKKKSDEESKIEPWTTLAKFKFQAEEEIKKVPGLNYIIARPAIVYGPGDISGLTHRFVCGAVYKQLGETMEFLWDKDLKYNTVHVEDVAAALWFLAQNGKNGEIYNLADNGDTTSGTVADLVSKLFGINVSFLGWMKSKVATEFMMKQVAEGANEKHLGPWSAICNTYQLDHTPLTPYVDEELLLNNAYHVDGSKITKLGFEYKHPALTEGEMRSTLKYFIDLKFFPHDFLV